MGPPDLSNCGLSNCGVGFRYFQACGIFPDHGLNACLPHWLPLGSSLVAQPVKSLPAMQEILVQFLDRKDRWRKDRLPTPVFLGFPSGSNGKEPACNAGDLGSISPWVRTIPWRRERLSTPVFWSGEFYGQRSPAGCSLWGRRESGTASGL